MNETSRRRIITGVLAAAMLLTSQPLTPWTAKAEAAKSTPVTAEVVTADGDYATYRAKQPTDAGTGSHQVAFEGSRTLAAGTSLKGKVTVPTTGWYTLRIGYQIIAADDGRVEMGVEIDGRTPYEELEQVLLQRLYENSKPVTQDRYGNEYQPAASEIKASHSQWLYDQKGLYPDPLGVYLTAGEHTVTLKNGDVSLAVESLTVAGEKSLPTYQEVAASYEGKAAYTGEQLRLEGEKATWRSEKSIALKSDSTDASLSPVHPYLDRMNYIGGSNWSSAGSTVAWKVTVEKDGLYKIGFHYLQNYRLGSYSYRRLEIDGEIPFAEAAQVTFPYTQKWTYMPYGDENGQPYLLYLTAGEHTLTLTTTLGVIGEQNRELADIVSEIATLYRQIVRITGETPDPNRDYDLFGQIGGMSETLETCADRLKALAANMKASTGDRSDSNIVVLQNMESVLRRMLAHPFQAQDYKQDYYNNYCSIGSVLYEMRSMPLAIDYIQVAGAEQTFENTEVGFWKRLGFGLERFYVSFTRDYDKHVSTGAEETLDLWLYWGRDQTKILNTLIQESFIPNYDIDVRVKVVNASLIQAMMSGDCPDLSLRLARTEPVNLALRGALYDLTQFDDYDEVIQRFMPSATVPYTFEGGVYALPDTQDFNIMFYRKDVLEELNLTVPKTWDEFLYAVSVISRNNMQVGITAPTTSTAPMFNTLLLQEGGTLYNEGLTKTQLTSKESLEAFTFYTRLYSSYSLPVTFDFYNRFRTGEMPLGITTYTTYNTLSAAATEIDGLWGMTTVPGGKSAGSGTGSVILKQTDNAEAAWTFLKWWTSGDTQAQFSEQSESVLGVASRQAPAAVDAIKKLSWAKEDLASILTQWEQVEEIPEAPGGYYTYRSIYQAFWDVVNNGSIPQDAMVEWCYAADNEIRRKRQEYRLPTE